MFRNPLILRTYKLQINGCYITTADSASITLRRDRADKESLEVTFVSTDSVRVSGLVEFEVYEGQNDVLVLCGTATWADNGLMRSNGSWSMDCSMAGVCGDRQVEDYIAGCCSGVPVILTKTIQVRLMSWAIPDDDEVVWKELGSSNGVIRPRKMLITETDMDDYDSEGKAGYGFYSEDMYPGEDGQLSWFNAGVRVGVGIGLGMCVCVGVGVGLIMLSYQARLDVELEAGPLWSLK